MARALHGVRDAARGRRRHRRLVAQRTGNALSFLSAAVVWSCARFVYLDVGCGAGTYTRWLSDQGLQVVGLDYSQPTLKKARQRMSPGIPLCAGDATRLPFAD